MLPKTDPTSTESWKKLKDHKKEIANEHMRDWFINDSLRFKEFSIEFNNILFDFSKNLLQKKTLNLLESLFEECGIYDAIKQQFEGSLINETEARAVLHTALRNRSGKPVWVKGKDVMPQINEVLLQMKTFSDKVIKGDWKGFTGEPITDIVNIGIGGSDLGPLMVYEALRPYHMPHINCHFVSNVDGAHMEETLKDLNPETTLFIIASKTFTTQETMTNANTAREWFLQKAKDQDIAKHFVAVSTNRKKVRDFGIDPAHMFVFWDWVGGRYSVWSAIGLSLCCGLGYNSFDKLLEGAHTMDEHFRVQPFKQNIPLLMAAIGLWYTNFWGATSEAMLPYNQNMHRFAAYFQQGNMESNGKSINRAGKPVDYTTGPIIWGEPGTNGQHAFYQLIHQGTHLIPCDFIAFVKSHYAAGDHHPKLLANFFAQTEALMRGKTLNEVKATEPGLKEDIYPYKIFNGNNPTNSILAAQLDEKTLGSLISCYEHKIFAQGVVWNIFSYDQWGVELGKQLAGKILVELGDDTETKDHDSSTNGLINYYKRNRF
ncbi:MAG: glucose-6-phosphate isomerase [Owenweeksia sp.]